MATVLHLETGQQPNYEETPEDTLTAKDNTRTCPQRVQPPRFRDETPRVFLTPRSLRELDHRNKLNPAPSPTEIYGYARDLVRFARNGGPDIRHLRGCADARVTHRASSTVSITSSHPPFIERDESMAKRTSAYDGNFAAELANAAIYVKPCHMPDGRKALKPNNLEDIRARLLEPSNALPPPMILSSMFDSFEKFYFEVQEATVSSMVMPYLIGDRRFPHQQDAIFTNMAPFTDNRTVRARPDYFEGAKSDSIHKLVKQDLNELIIPTKRVVYPIVPNFFLELKGHGGMQIVATKQVCYDGAHGARAIHALQNYGKTEPEYDGNAYTISWTFSNGSLEVYVHHTTAPVTEGGLPEYHMTLLGVYPLSLSYDDFIQGLRAFQNSRDIANEYRMQFIEQANQQASKEATASTTTGDTAVSLHARVDGAPRQRSIDDCSPRFPKGPSESSSQSSNIKSYPTRKTRRLSAVVEDAGQSASGEGTGDM
ncbi:hypothetical protein S40288_11482 [Stachybotrys chartarum IBT 40288]|nr:hypothetical protein S40288_11482 [Stachybotrys chartarum IBT 40288]